MRRSLLAVITLGLLTGLGPFTVDLYLPAFPALKEEFQIGDPQLQATLSATIIGFAAGQLLVGPVSDRFGRRFPLLLMSSVHVIASILVANANSAVELTLLRGVQGFGAAGSAVVSMAMARDLFEGPKLLRTLATLSLIIGMAPIIAPIIGSWIVSLGNWRTTFWALAGYGIVVIILVVVLLAETRPPQERTRGGMKAVRHAYGRVLKDRQYVGAALVAVTGFTGLFGYVSTSSLLFQEVHGLSAQGFGAVFAICSVGVLMGTQTGSRLGARISPRKVLIVATSLMVVASTALLLVDSLGAAVPFLVMCIVPYTMGFGMLIPCSQVLALEHHRRDSGAAASLMGAGQFTLAAMAGPVIGTVELTSAAPMATAMLICAVAATVVLWAVLRPLSRGEASAPSSAPTSA